MAGAGNKLFTSGSVLTASDVNTYLMDQTIMRFTSTTTRDAAFGGAGEPTLAEGMFAYTDDTNTLWSYNGSSWVAVLGSNIGAIQTSNRNKIINGGFDVWQRGTTGFGTGVYNADRWYGAVNAGAGSFAQSTATPLVSGSRFFVRGTASSASTNLFVYTALETADVVRLRSKVVVLSAYVRGTYTGNISLTADYSTSTDALVSQSTSVASLTTTAVTTSFQRVSLSFTVPSDAAGLRLGIGTTATPMANTQTIDIWGVQLEEGSVATPFEFEDISTTLEKCQRYLYALDLGLNGVSGFCDSTTAAIAYLMFPTTMRSTPTLTVTAADFEVRRSGASSSPVTDLTSQGTPNGVRLNVTVASGLTAGTGIGISAASGSKTMRFSAEL
jgi:hypothetical protein